jgi:hypothetical protein
MAVLHLHHSGWFPFCIPAASGIWNGSGFPAPDQVGPGTFYPAGVPLATAMRWYWKVKTWHVASDIVLSGTQPDPPFAFTLPLSAAADVPVAAAQNDLACPTPVSHNDATVLFTLWTTTAQIYRLGSGLDALYYPCLRLRLQNAGQLTVSSYKSDLVSPKPWPQPGTVDGQNVALWYDEATSFDGTGGGPGDNGPWSQTQAGTAATLF